MGQRQAGESPASEIELLLAEAKNGSLEAVGRLLEQHRAFLWALASEEIAGETHLTFTVSDVVQSAQLEAIRDLRGFRGTSAGEFRSWLRHILRHNVLDLRRARDRRPHRAKANGLGADGHADDDRSPSSHVAAGELSEKLHDAVRTLPHDERVVIEMHYFEGKTYTEVGERLGRTPEAVRKLWGRALVRLQSAARPLR
jgi:RNA polymerase sigma-70 factor (ECF subfamily)